jgi:hypothetical protein
VEVKIVDYPDESDKGPFPVPDERISVLHQELRRIKGSAFEVVQQPK